MDTRCAVLGNAGGGKSVLARAIADRHALPYLEVDRMLWREGWTPVPPVAFSAEHAAHVATPNWVMDGMGSLRVIEATLERATVAVLVDLPLWQHFALAAERQIAWHAGRLRAPPAGLSEPPPTRTLFKLIRDVDRELMPRVRERLAAFEADGRPVHVIDTLDRLTAAQEGFRIDGVDPASRQRSTRHW